MTGKREPTVVISTRVPARFLEPMEVKRGRRTRSRWLADLVAQGLGEPTGEARPLKAPAPAPAATTTPTPTPTRRARPAPPAAEVDCTHKNTKPHPGSVSGLRKCEDCGTIGPGLGRR